MIGGPYRNNRNDILIQNFRNIYGTKLEKKWEKNFMDKGIDLPYKEEYRLDFMNNYHRHMVEKGRIKGISIAIRPLEKYEIKGILEDMRQRYYKIYPHKLPKLKITPINPQPKLLNANPHIVVSDYSQNAAQIAISMSKIPFLDKVVLTNNTRKMCSKLFDAYGRSGKHLAGIAAVAIGTVVGGAAANNITRYIPGFGAATHGTIAYGLHSLTGNGIIKFLDNTEESQALTKSDAVFKYVTILQDSLSGLEFLKSESAKNLLRNVIEKAGENARKL